MDNLDEKYKSKNPFTVPDRYFDTLGDRVMDRIKDEEGKTAENEFVSDVKTLSRFSGIIRFRNDRHTVASS